MWGLKARMTHRLFRPTAPGDRAGVVYAVIRPFEEYGDVAELWKLVTAVDWMDGVKPVEVLGLIALLVPE